MNHTTHRHARRAAGFTLIELLVVIAIIAIVLTMMAAALGRAVMVARSAANLASMRELGRFTELFAGENDGAMMRSTHSYFAHQQDGARPWYRSFYTLATGEVVRPDQQAWHDFVDRAFRSPFDERRSGESESPFAPEYNGSYAFNVYYELASGETPDGRTWRRMHQVPGPASTVVFGELASDPGRTVMRDHVMAHFWITAGTRPEDEIRSVPTLPGSGVCFLDGHAEHLLINETIDLDNDIDRWNPSTAP